MGLNASQIIHGPDRRVIDPEEFDSIRYRNECLFGENKDLIAKVEALTIGMRAAADINEELRKQLDEAHGVIRDVNDRLFEVAKFRQEIIPNFISRFFSGCAKAGFRPSIRIVEQLIRAAQ